MRARKLIYPLLLVLATPLNVHSQFAFGLRNLHLDNVTCSII